MATDALTAPFDIAAYLARIGCDAVPVTPEGLAALQSAQLRAVTFENVDPLLGREPDMALPAIVAKIVMAGRGGYCFELNQLLAAAMTALGFPVRRTLGRVRKGAPSGGPRSHLALLTEVGGRRFLVDAGFGGPASLIPLAIDRDGDQTAPNGLFRIIDDPATGEKVVQRMTAAGWFSLYGFDEAHVGEPDIAAANYLCSHWPGAPFPGHLMLNRFGSGERIAVFDRALTIETPYGEERREFSGYDEFAETLVTRLELPLGTETLTALWQKLPPPQTAANPS